MLDDSGYLLQDGINGETMWEDALLDREVYLIVPGIHTKILLDKLEYFY